MSDLVEIKVGSFPDCWETCGTCASEDLEVAEVCVSEGESVGLYHCLLVLEATKTEMEVNAPCAGTVEAILVEPGDAVGQDETLLLLSTSG